LLTVHERIVPGPVLRAGSSSSYRSLVKAEGERHSVRTELTGPIGHDVRARGNALLAIGHMTDLHVTDVESPARFEFLNRFAGDARFRELLTMQRPQEALNSHAIAAMVRAMNGIEAAPVSGSPLELLVMTGDAIDNAQANEFATYVTLFEGGMVSPASGGPEIESVQSPGWPDDIFWKPDGSGFGPDQYRVAHGFPLVPGLLDRAMRPFESQGLRVPWIGCHGNHEELCQGVGIVTPELARAMVAGRKPIGSPEVLTRPRRWRLSSRDRSASWPAQPSPSRPTPAAGHSKSPRSSKRISSQAQGPTVTASHRPTGATAPRTTCTTLALSASSSWIRHAAQGARTEASTAISSRGSRRGSSRCTRPTRASPVRLCARRTRTGWS
jgi:hypothetical protein